MNVVIGTIGLDIFRPNAKETKERLIRNRRQTWRKVFHAGILIEPHIPELEEFKEYFNGAIKVILVANNEYIFKICLKLSLQNISYNTRTITYP